MGFETTLPTTTDKLFREYQDDINKGQMCDCPVACKSSNYDATISYASVSQIIKDSSQNEVNRSPQDLERGLATVSFANYISRLYIIVYILD